MRTKIINLSEHRNSDYIRLIAKQLHLKFMTGMHAKYIWAIKVLSRYVRIGYGGWGVIFQFLIVRLRIHTLYAIVDTCFPISKLCVCLVCFILGLQNRTCILWYFDISHSFADVGISWKKQIDTITVNAPAPYVTRKSSAMILTLWEKRTLFVHGE